MATLTHCQENALRLLEGLSNVFLTGVPGSGKSYLIRHYLEKKNRKEHPILASTGAAAVLVGGRTFHGFFGLGIGEGGVKATIERAVKNHRLVKRLRKTKCIIIDEVSMLSGTALFTASTICKQAKQNARPWGGLRVIAVGDFAQLPPVNPWGKTKDWAFLSSTWQESEFVPALLKTIMRTDDPILLEILGLLRDGIVNGKVADFLNSRTRAHTSEFKGTHLFPHRQNVEKYNLERLESLPGPYHSFATQYKGVGPFLEMMRKSAPVPEMIHLKKEAWVMLRSNDPEGRWVNGSFGTIRQINENSLGIKLRRGERVTIEPITFTLLNPDGNEVASCKNFPINLAYASTIHKVQGMTLDKAVIDLRHLWEPGHAYVALSRVKHSDGIFLSGWTSSSIQVDTDVKQYYHRLEGPSRIVQHEQGAEKAPD
jgi:ATP-dependent DNA helicase PIF1